jgi:hypothetical protein
MARFGGSEFIGFSVPLVFSGRYFLLEPGEKPLLSVFVEQNGKPIFEVLKNKPARNQITDVTTNATGVVTITDKKTGKFLYKVRPGSETSIVFGKLDRGEIPARISDRLIQVGGITVENCRFLGNMAGVVVEPDGSVRIGAPIPAIVLGLLNSR